MKETVFSNPFKPGAGHTPPYLAGRDVELHEARKRLKQTVVTENLVLTGLRGVGKTVLLEKIKNIAFEEKWLWAENDLSESASVTETTLATRILTDLALTVSFIEIGRKKNIGFHDKEDTATYNLDFSYLSEMFIRTPGLISDKLKAVLNLVWTVLARQSPNTRGVVFAYDEAQNLTDHSSEKQYPLSLLLEVFQSLQKQNIPFMLLLTGLPTLLPKLVETRTYAERMFRTIFLRNLNKIDARDAIEKPVINSPLRFSDTSIDTVISVSGGYPYFIQFICKEAYDVWLQATHEGEEIPSVSPDDILRKLDADFYYGRWANVTDKQRDVLRFISRLDNCDDEFSGQEIVEISKKQFGKKISSSQVNQILSALLNAGMVYKNRHGKYSLAVPLLSHFIRRLEVEISL
jgi:DNA polymerase III delta prime subunit